MFIYIMGSRFFVTPHVSIDPSIRCCIRSLAAQQLPQLCLKRQSSTENDRGCRGWFVRTTTNTRGRKKRLEHRLLDTLEIAEMCRKVSGGRRKSAKHTPCGRSSTSRKTSRWSLKSKSKRQTLQAAPWQTAHDSLTSSSCLPLSFAGRLQPRLRRYDTAQWRLFCGSGLSHCVYRIVLIHCGPTLKFSERALRRHN